MNYLSVLFLALFWVLTVVAGIFLYARLHGKDATAAEPPSEPPRLDFPSDENETAAIDQFLYDRCCRYMVERRPFLVDAFSLQDLARVMYTNKVYLSKTINRFSGRNFKQYVNYYRVMYSMELFRKNMGLRVGELALLSGFHSETAYLRNFKIVMGEQPSHWCARMRQKYMEQK